MGVWLRVDGLNTIHQPSTPNYNVLEQYIPSVVLSMIRGIIIVYRVIDEKYLQV